LGFLEDMTTTWIEAAQQGWPHAAGPCGFQKGEGEELEGKGKAGGAEEGYERERINKNRSSEFGH